MKNLFLDSTIKLNITIVELKLKINLDFFNYLKRSRMKMWIYEVI